MQWFLRRSFLKIFFGSDELKSTIELKYKADQAKGKGEKDTLPWLND